MEFVASYDIEHVIEADSEPEAVEKAKAFAAKLMTSDTEISSVEYVSVDPW